MNLYITILTKRSQTSKNISHMITLDKILENENQLIEVESRLIVAWSDCGDEKCEGEIIERL